MRNGRVWAGLLGVENTTSERVEFDEDEQRLIAHVRPSRWRRQRCGVCQRRCRGYDQGEGRRRGRALDLGTMQAVLEADAPSRPGHDRARRLKHARYALWKNPENLTERQADKLAWIAKTDPRLHRAYLLKEGLRHVFAVKGEAGREALDRWLSWARRCRIPAFVNVARKIVKHRAAIDATLDHNLSNGLIESTNTKIRLLQRLAFGFKSAEALIALAMLPRRLSARPPGRTAK